MSALPLYFFGLVLGSGASCTSSTLLSDAFEFPAQDP